MREFGFTRQALDGPGKAGRFGEKLAGSGGSRGTRDNKAACALNTPPRSIPPEPDPAGNLWPRCTIPSRERRKCLAGLLFGQGFLQDSDNYPKWRNSGDS
jgi:hypothetical protein